MEKALIFALKSQLHLATKKAIVFMARLIFAITTEQYFVRLQNCGWEHWILLTFPKVATNVMKEQLFSTRIYQQAMTI